MKKYILVTFLSLVINLSGLNASVEIKKLNRVLMAAVDAGLEDIVELLLEKGADVNASDNYGNTVLIEAVRLRSKEMVELLLKKGAKANVAMIMALQH